MPRDDTINFKAANQALEKRPKFVVEIAFDNAKTDLHYMTTDEETETPSDAANIYPNTIKRITGKGQSLNPMKALSSIGGANVELVDVDGGVTDLIQFKLIGGDGLRRKTTTFYVGYEGLLWADYAKIFTQINEAIEYPYGGVNLKTEDIKRTVKKDIFDLEKTNLYETINAIQTQLRVISATNFAAVEHGTSYQSDAPSQEVGYVQLGAKDTKEIIRWKGKVASAIQYVGGGVFSGGDTFTSDGTWTGVSTPGTGSWRGVTVGNNRLVAVGAAANPDIMYSTNDGDSWTGVDIATRNWESVIYGNKFVAVAGFNTSRVAYSTDGTAWTDVIVDLNSWRAVTFGVANGVDTYVAVSSGGTDRCMYSTDDGATWTPVTILLNEWYDVTFIIELGLFVAVAQSGSVRCITSPDGFNWTSQTIPAKTYQTIISGNGVLVAIAITGSNPVATSTDAINWVAQICPARSWKGGTYGDGLFVIVNLNSVLQGVMTSPDGENWTERDALGSTNQWWDVAYINGRFVAVGSAGTLRSMYSFRAFDSSIFAVDQQIEFTNTTSNNGTYTIATIPDSTSFTINETFTNETSSVIITANIQFYDCARGRLGSQAAIHEVDSTITASDKKPVIEEYVYLELPLPKLIKAITTGDLHGQSGKTLPPKWHLDIDDDFFSESHYTAIGNDLWNPSDDTEGMVFRFVGLRKQDAKKFIAEQCLRPMFCFDPILNDGQISLKRMSNVITDSVYVRVLDESNVVDFGTPREVFKEVVNVVHIFWNWDDQKGKFTRDHPYINQSSRLKHQDAKPLILYLRGLHGSRHTVSLLRTIASGIFDRYSGPPIKRTVKCLHTQNDLEVGEIIRLIDPNSKDPSSTLGTTDRSMEIRSKDLDWHTGQDVFGLFGSSQKSAPLVSTIAVALNDGFYTTYSSGVPLLAANKLDNDDSTGLTTNLTDGVLHITAGAELTGNADMTANAAIYWYDGVVQLDAGVIVTWTDNVQFRIMDTTNNGDLTSIGGGLAGVSAPQTIPATNANQVGGTAGGVGVTEAGGGIVIFTLGLPSNRDIAIPNTEGTYKDAVPHFALTHDGDSIIGLPTDLRGCSGGPGGGIYGYLYPNVYSYLNTGGDGGAGGGGILIITRSYSGGASSSINTSGVEGTTGSQGAFTSPGYAGGGGGGAPGGVLILLDGSSAIATGENITANRPAVSMIGIPWDEIESNTDFTTLRSSRLRGAPEESFAQSMYKYQWLQENIAAVEDTPETTGAGTSISVGESANTPAGQDQCTLTFTVNGSRDSNFAYDNIYYKPTADTGYQLNGSADVGLVLSMDGTTYDIKAHPVSIDGVESTDFVSTTYTVLNQSGGVDTGDIGSDVTDDYTKGSLSYKTNFDTISGWDETLTGSASSSLLTGPTQYSLIGGADSDTARASRRIHTVTTDADPTWAKDRSVICIHTLTGADASHAYEVTIGSGQYTANSRFIGFRIVRTGTDVEVYARSGDGTTTEETLVTTTAYATFVDTYYKYEVVFVSGTDVKFYIDENLEATHTTNIPSGTTDAEYLFDHYLTVTTWNSVAIGSNLVEINVVQAA